MLQGQLHLLAYYRCIQTPDPSLRIVNEKRDIQEYSRVSWAYILFLSSLDRIRYCLFRFAIKPRGILLAIGS